MNWVAQAASAAAFAGVHGNTVGSLVAMLVASASAAACRFPASRVPITFGCRNGNALLLRSSDSPGTSATPSVESPRRSRAVFRYSREVRRRSGNAPAAVGSPGVLPVPPVPDDAPVPDGPPAPILPVQPRARTTTHAEAPTARRPNANRMWVIFEPSLTENLPKARLEFPASSVPARAENDPRRARKSASPLHLE